MENEIYFKCQPIGIRKHYAHIVGIHVLYFVVILGGIYREFPFWWIGVALGSYLYINIGWWFRLKKENNQSAFKMNGSCITMEQNGQTVTRLWSDIKQVHQIGPYDTKEKRPGFIIDFGDDTGWMVYQRLEGYKDFYQSLMDRGIPGTEQDVWIHNIDIYGKSTDDPKWIQNLVR
ncbi:hypothetical protein [Bowmanella dokdonensis]|uniref:Transmembrane protein n=1 Tax=Bowmanella dokdonensis TaxID=751969 RepID=A0A939INT9_9ALTE|nr:hypothetical protein [Bowmanella dokdonensis]MBN7825195.1 hypothetical protein [Bowmanella dokdonensis]